MIAARSGYARQLNSRYASYGQNATFTNPIDDQPAVLRMIDMTKGVEVGEEAKVATIEPFITARCADVFALGLEPSDFQDVVITISGEQWRVISHAPHPSPWGLQYGQIYFMVEAENG